MGVGGYRGYVEYCVQITAKNRQVCSMALKLFQQLGGVLFPDAFAGGTLSAGGGKQVGIGYGNVLRRGADVYREPSGSARCRGNELCQRGVYNDADR